MMLTWEFPPHSVGGLARHVEDLTKALVDAGHQVHVVTYGPQGLPAEEKVNGARVHRIHGYPLNPPDFLTWTLQLNLALLEKASILQNEAPFQIVHAHDWLVAFAARALKHTYRLPLVATIHATECGRHHGLHNALQHYISSAEWWLTYEAWKVIVCSKHMEHEVSSLFQLPRDKVYVIPNGVDMQKFKAKKENATGRLKQSPNNEKIIFYIGRLVREKGVQVLLAAGPQIFAAVPDARIVIAGTGPMERELKRQAHDTGIGHKVTFAGYVSDQMRAELYAKAAVAVFPSLYEPFGIVALEGMASGTPVVVSDTGGLAEIVTHGENGLKALPGNVDSVAGNIIALLKDEQLARKIAENGRALVKEVYDWKQIAAKTAEVYSTVLREYLVSPWGMKAPVDRRLTPPEIDREYWAYEYDVNRQNRFSLIDKKLKVLNDQRGRSDFA